VAENLGVQGFAAMAPVLRLMLQVLSAGWQFLLKPGLVLPLARFPIQSRIPHKNVILLHSSVGN
jgi:hypothetical protein